MCIQETKRLKESTKNMRFENGIFHDDYQALPIKHIVSVATIIDKEPSRQLLNSKGEVDPNQFWKYLYPLFIAVIVFILVMTFSSEYRYGDRFSQSFRISCILGVFSAFFIKYPKNRALKYGVQLNLTSGQHQTYYTWDEDFRNKMIEAFENALALDDKKREGFTQNINLKTTEIGEVHYTDNSTTNVTNNYHFDIVNSYYEGVSKEDLKFLNNEFKQGIQELASQIQTTGNEALQTALEDFRKEINLEKPESGRINSCWERIKQCSEGMDIYQNVLGAGTLVSTAIAAFM